MFQKSLQYVDIIFLFIFFAAKETLTIITNVKNHCAT